MKELTSLLGCLDKIVSGLLQTTTGLLRNVLGGLGLGDLLDGLLGGLLGGILGGGGGILGLGILDTNE